MSQEHAALDALAIRWGVQPGYTDWRGQARRPSAEALTAVLRSLGAPIQEPDGAEEALRASLADADGGPPPVLLAWGGWLSPTASLPADAQAEVVLEDGGRLAGTVASLGDAALPLGLHTLRVERAGDVVESAIIAAPPLAASVPDRPWGLFLPLHALHTARTGALADFTDLRALGRWVRARGGDLVGVLPLLAAFLDGDPFDPSPYAPASRLFWNELYVDPEEAAVRARAPDGAVPPRTAPARKLVDYRAAAADHRRALQAAAAAFFERGGAEEDPDFRRFLEERPRAADYARFRGATARFGRGWPAWPERAREGRLEEADVDPREERYHLFAQWAADRQLAAHHADPTAADLYLDLPLGVHGAGYDVWRERHLFAAGMAAGAPPDALFSGGQNWGFPPLVPAAARAGGHRYFAACLRHQLRHAGALRLDHVMSLERLYWIPDGFPATDGVYVTNAVEELFAVLTLESWRAGTPVIGEDLGTVTDRIRHALAERHVLRMYVAPFEARPHEDHPLPDAPREALATLNTHDMPPFAAFWSGADLADQRALGWLDEAGEANSRAERQAVRAALARAVDLPGDCPAEVAFPALLERLAAGPARILLANAEDLWGETRPQNVPGTSEQRPNWRRRAAHALEAWGALPGVEETLARVQRARSNGES
ncbi:MAG: 4-alpha-glucanotransferase [Gemmatimonadota bacterium]